MYIACLVHADIDDMKRIIKLMCRWAAGSLGMGFGVEYFKALWQYIVVVIIVMRLEQRIAVALMMMHHNSMLVLYEEAAAPSDRPSPHFEDLDGWIRVKHEVFIGAHKYVHQHKWSGQYHAIRHDWHGRGSKHRCQVDPATDWWR